jgi:DNA-binding MarR family transcriptional regulator
MKARRTRHTLRRITRHYDRSLSKLGVASQQVTILAVVELDRSVSISDLAAYLGMDRTTLTRNLRPLLEQRLLERMDAKDRRKKMIAITDLGRERLAKALPLWHVAQKEALEMIGAEEWQEIRVRLDSALTRINRAL